MDDHRYTNHVYPVIVSRGQAVTERQPAELECIGACFGNHSGQKIGYFLFAIPGEYAGAKLCKEGVAYTLNRLVHAGDKRVAFIIIGIRAHQNGALDLQRRLIIVMPWR